MDLIDADEMLKVRGEARIVTTDWIEFTEPFERIASFMPPARRSFSVRGLLGKG